MRLHTKLALFTTISTLTVLIVFVVLLPQIMQEVAFSNTNQALLQQKQKVLQQINVTGIDYYLEGDSTYGSYSMLKDEYISLEHVDATALTDTLITEQRLVDRDTINYRILMHSFRSGDQAYLLEIGKKTASISADARALQQTALYILLPLALVILLIQIVYNRYLLKPLGYIIRSRLLKASFPFNRQADKLKSSTYDFLYLDESISQLMQQINYAFEKEREFTSNASHELMTPISILQSKIENLAEDESLSDDQYKKLESITHIIRRLKKIVNALLLISRVDNNQFDNQDVLVINEMVEQVVEELQHRIAQKDIVLDIRLSRITLKNINRDLLFQLFYNIINNAIKFNKTGGSINITDRQLSGSAYAVLIEDSGTGIDEQLLKEVFYRFKKGATRAEGYGLGLSIVDAIARHEGLLLDVQSQKNKGSCFTVTFQEKHL
ncbi:HAMP domain-containing sensor histidine kinase [Niabella yanshanensis]|uniref:histidine kinase n=1 Tax=Niabella yanshanensis TaxID=577386 RepID=A0ABZ0W0E9_9BACT|nr:HAMP domain-containing sensor histidine kinase [Niabella yanshanensis]WQD36652.1 HAMP domain-containing sensor histidine kinase [Niabella yanshanensis]